MSGAHVLVDETKRRDYLLVAGVVVTADLQGVRGALRPLVLPGQRRPYINSESDPRRRAIAAVIASSPVRASVYSAGTRYRTERDRRSACLRALVEDAAQRSDAMLVLEQDDSLQQWDAQRLIEFTRAAGCKDTLR